MTNPTDIVVAYSDMKDAALYFQYVIPDFTYILDNALRKNLRPGEDNNGAQAALAETVSDQIRREMTELLPPHIRDDKEYWKLANKVPIWSALRRLIDEFRNHPDFEVTVAALEPIEQQIRATLGVSFFHDRSLEVSTKSLIRHYHLDILPVIVPNEWLSSRPHIESAVKEHQSSDDWRIRLINANLIDTSKVSWDQILDFREDTASLDKLIRLRRFFTTKYDGKSQSFVEADLHLRLEDHDAAAKKFGFDLKMGWLEAVLSSKWLQGSIAGVGLATICGQPLAAIASGIGGVILEAASSAVKIERRKFEYNQMMNQHPLGYILDAKRDLESPQKP